MLSNFAAKLSRRYVLEGDLMKTDLKRCLTTVDLTLMGIGSMVGSGIYVLAGVIAREITGPALFLSFIVAALAASLSAWCYAEFGAQIPKTGSAYLYTYVIMGELVAFVTGWNIILEHLVGLAAVVRGLIGYINSVLDDSLDKVTPQALLDRDWNFYPAIIIVILTIIICLGIKESLITNNILTFINLAVALFVIISGTILADFANWSDFLPNGPSSIIKGAAQSYFGFTGYDIITISSEEALTPEYSIPIALAFCIFFVCALYCALSISLTLMVPYSLISVDSAFASAFEYNDWVWAKYLASVGAIAALICVSLTTALHFSRLVYAMALDGLIFRQLGKVNETTRVPVVAALAICIAVCLFSFFMSLQELAELMSFGTLLAHLILAIGVIIMRYQPVDMFEHVLQENKIQDFSQVYGEKLEKTPLIEPKRWQNKQTWTIVMFVALVIVLNILLYAAENRDIDVIFKILMFLSAIFTLLSVMALVYLKLISVENGFSKRYRVPFVPFWPGFSVFVNIYLMTHLNEKTWLRFVVWMAFGFLVYSAYGIKNSSLEKKERVETEIEKS